MFETDAELVCNCVILVKTLLLVVVVVVVAGWLLMSATFNVVGWLDVFVGSRKTLSLGLVLDSKCVIIIGLLGGVLLV